MRPALLAPVLAGGALGAAAREAVEQALPAPATGFPTATFAINLVGALALGALLDTLLAAGPDTGWRRLTRLAGGTGFCGAFTTYSTLAVETVQLARHGATGTAAAYAAASVGLGVVAAGAGIAAAAGRRRAAGGPVHVVGPVDPDV